MKIAHWAQAAFNLQFSICNFQFAIPAALTPSSIATRGSRDPGWTRDVRAGGSILWLWRLKGAPAAAADDAGPLSVASRRSPKMARLEAVLLVADAPLSPRRLAQFASLADAT